MNLVKSYAKNLFNAPLRSIGAALVGKVINFSVGGLFAGGLPTFMDNLPKDQQYKLLYKQPQVLNLDSPQDIERAYFNCSTLNTVIVNKAQFSVNGKVKIVDNKGKEVNNMRTREVLAKMAKPNLIQNYAMFRAESKIYLPLYGYHLTWYVPNGIGGFVNIWNLNPVNCKIEFTDVYFKQTELKDIIKKITYYYRGKEVDIPVNEVVIVRDTTLTKSHEAQQNPPLLPSSRVQGMQLVVNNNINAYRSRGNLITSRGAQVIVSPNQKDSASAITLLEHEKQDLLNEWNNTYGIMDGQSNAIFSPKGVLVQKVGLSTQELMLFDETKETMNRIADALGWDKDLLNTEDGAKYENQLQAEVQVYQGTIIPEDENELPQLWSAWHLEEIGLKVVTDYNDVACLKQYARNAEKADEENNTMRLNNLARINTMPVEYDIKLNIAVGVLGITIDEAKLYITQNDTTQPQQPAAA